MTGLVAILLGVSFMLWFAEPSKLEPRVEKVVRAWLPDARSIGVRIRGKRGLPTLEGDFDSVEFNIAGCDLSPAILTRLLGQQAESLEMQRSHLHGEAKEPSAAPLKHSAWQRSRRRHLGRIKRIVVNLTDCKLEGLPIARAHFTLYNVRYDVDALLKKRILILASADGGEFESELATSSLRNAIEVRLERAGLTNAQVQFGEATIRINAAYPLWFIRIPFSVAGRLHIEQPDKICFSIDDVKVLHVIPIPPKLAAQLFDDINPVFVLPVEKLPVRISLTDIEVHPDRLYLKGQLELPNQRRATLKGKASTRYVRGDEVWNCASLRNFYIHQPMNGCALTIAASP